MKKIKEMLHKWLNSESTDGQEWFYNDMDIPLKRKMFGYIAISAVLFVLALLSLPLVRSLSVFAMLLILSLLAVIYTLFRLKDIYSGKVIAIAGDYYKGSPKRSAVKKFFSVINKRGYLLLRLNDGNFLKVFPPESFQCDEESRIVVYVYERSLRSENNNTVVADELVAIKVLELNQ